MGSQPMKMQIEVIIIPVSDVDRAKQFYGQLGWRLDLDVTESAEYRVVQFTPPGSACSIIFGRGVSSTIPGSSQGIHLMVPDLAAARSDLLERGIEVGEPFHDST